MTVRAIVKITERFKLGRQITTDKVLYCTVVYCTVYNDIIFFSQIDVPAYISFNKPLHYLYAYRKIKKTFSA